LESDLTQKIGFFGGSFDPIHNGHLNLAVEMLERHNLDGVYFCPTSQSPHKKNNPPVASKDQRRAMVTAAISPFPKFTLLDLELQNHDYCYTIDTLRTLVGQGKNDYFLIIGEDSVEKLHTWKEIDELLKLAPPLIASRSTDKPFKTPLLAKIQKGITKMPLFDISSTEVRSRLHKKLTCAHLVPAKVWDYIQQHKLYE
jgi:nicotinate-nucleotide adenylyltransferase